MGCWLPCRQLLGILSPAVLWYISPFTSVFPMAANSEPASSLSHWITHELKSLCTVQMLGQIIPGQLSGIAITYCSKPSRLATFTFSFLQPCSLCDPCIAVATHSCSVLLLMQSM